MRIKAIGMLIALAVLVPAFALLGTWMIYKKILPARSWILVLFLQAMLVGSLNGRRH